MPDRDHSGHPVDQLIRALILAPRTAAAVEIERIRDRISTASFNMGKVKAESDERGLVYLDRRIQSRDNSLFIHLVRRVVLDQQWAEGTTAELYVDDLHRAAQTESAGLAIYSRRGGSVAIVLAPTQLVVPVERRGPGSLQELVVVYSADRGIIVTGYQVEGRGNVAIPKDALWLL